MAGTDTADSKYAHPSNIPAYPPWVSCGYRARAPVRGSMPAISMYVSAMKSTQMPPMIHDTMDAGPAVASAESTANSQPEPMIAPKESAVSWVRPIVRRSLRSDCSNPARPVPEAGSTTVGRSCASAIYPPSQPVELRTDNLRTKSPRADQVLQVIRVRVGKGRPRWHGPCNSTPPPKDNRSFGRRPVWCALLLPKGFSDKDAYWDWFYPAPR